MDFYPWLVFIHVSGAFMFVLGHGGSASASVRLHQERDPQRVRALLELSSQSLGVAYIGLAFLLVGGIAAAFVGGWWGHLWIWASIVLLVLIAVAMYPLGSQHYAKVRHVVGLRTYQDKKDAPDPVPGTPEELEALLDSDRPALLTAIGGGGLLVIIWLMIFKPF